MKTKEELLKDEIWKDIIGYEGYYQISSYSRLKSLDRVVTNLNGRQINIKGKISNNGFLNKALVVSLSKNNKIEAFLLYRLSAVAFIPNPENKPEINHIDGNRMNNNIANLEWCTRSENEKHAYDTGLYISRKGNAHHMSKVTELQVLEMKQLLSLGKNKKEISEMFNVSYSNTCKILKGKTWKHLNDSEFIKKETLKQ